MRVTKIVNLVKSAILPPAASIKALCFLKIILEKHKALIEAAGGKMADFIKLTIFVTRIQNNIQVWKARAEFFKGDFPACSLVEVSKLAAPNIFVEIEGIAHIGKGN